MTSDLIEITEDKLENILLKHRQAAADARSWSTPLSLLLALLTATFPAKWGLAADAWQAEFAAGAVVLLIWLLCCFISLIATGKVRPLGYLISRIRNAGADSMASPPRPRRRRTPEQRCVGALRTVGG